MILKTIFNGIVNTNTNLGHFDLSGYQKYAVLFRVDHASPTDPLRLLTYNNNMQIYSHDFIPTNGWYNYTAIHEVFHPDVSFVFNVWNTQANLMMWIYATCCGEKNKMTRPLVPKSIKKIDFTKSFENNKIIYKK